MNTAMNRVFRDSRPRSVRKAQKGILQDTGRNRSCSRASGGTSSGPLPGPEQVLEYLGRYTHRVALSSDRLMDHYDGCVRFRWRDYADHDRRKVMTLDADEFLRRFLLHVVPRASCAFAISACSRTRPCAHHDWSLTDPL